MGTLFLEPFLRTLTWNPSLGTFTWNPSPGIFTENPFAWNLYFKPYLELYLEFFHLEPFGWNPTRDLKPFAWNLNLEAFVTWSLYFLTENLLIATLEPPGSFVLGTCNYQSLELRNLPLNQNLCLIPFRLEVLLGTLTWSLGTSSNLYSQLSRGTSEPSETLLGTFEPLWNLHLQPLLGTLEPLGTFTWNLEPFLETYKPLGALLGTLRTFRNLCLEPLLRTLEPPGSVTWNPNL